MILELFILFNVLGFLILMAGFGIGIFRTYAINGKGIALLLFLFSSIIFMLLSVNSFNIEIVDCNYVSVQINSTTTVESGCQTDIKVYDYLGIFYGALAAISMILVMVYAFLTFGDYVAVRSEN